MRAESPTNCTTLHSRTSLPSQTVACSLAERGSRRAAASVSSPARLAFDATVSSSTSTDMSGTCQGHVRDVSRTCQGRVVDVSWTCHRDVSWTCRRAPRRMAAASPRRTRHIAQAARRACSTGELIICSWRTGRRGAPAGRFGEIWRACSRAPPSPRYGGIWGDMGRHEEMWGDMGRYGEPVLVLLPRDLPRAPLAHPLPRRADTRVLVLQRRAPL